MNTLHMEALINVALFYFIMSANCSTFVTYREPNFAGTSTSCSDTKSCNVSDVISIKMLIGSCGQILDSKTGRSLFIEGDVTDTDYYYNGPLSTCPTHQKNIACPEGTFVKKIEWDVIFNMKEGVRLSCNKPESSGSDTVTISSHQTESFSKSNSSTCAAFTELTITRNISTESDVSLNIGKKNCVAVDKTGGDTTLECQRYAALSGINFLIETKTNYIKSTSLVCSDVPNIGKLCEADDDEELLSLPSTNTSGKSIIKITKTVGVGLKSLMSETEKREFEFYYQFGRDVDYPLLANFRDNVGISIVTGYDWGSAPKSTWREEHSVTIEIEISSECETKLFEIVGKCSYMTIRPYHLKRVDDCSRGSIVTDKSSKSEAAD